METSSTRGFGRPGRVAICLHQWGRSNFIRVDTLTGIRVFRQIVESGSFVEAAERLEMSTAAVSKHVAQVEERLGVRLLNRNSRGVSLTEPGRQYFERTKTILEDLEEIEVELGALSRAPRGSLRITCQSFTAGQRFADLLAEYRLRYPEVMVYASFEDRDVDLVEEGYDIALRTTYNMESLPPGLIARSVRPTRRVLAAAQSYLDRHGVPESPADLNRHQFVSEANVDAVHFEDPEEPIDIARQIVLRFRSSICVANAVAAGIGLAALPSFCFTDPAFKGRLVPLLPQYPLRGGTLYLAYVSRKHVPLKIRTFIDFFVEKVASPTPDPFPQTVPTP